MGYQRLCQKRPSDRLAVAPGAHELTPLGPFKVVSEACWLAKIVFVRDTMVSSLVSNSVLFVSYKV